MPRGPKVTIEVRGMIINVHEKHKKWKGPEVRNEVEHLLKNGKKNFPEGFPSVSTVQDVIKEHRKRNEGALDRPWSTASIANSKYQIPPEALPTVLKVWALSQIGVITYPVEADIPDLDHDGLQILTVREALWIGRLYHVIERIPGKSERDYLKTLWVYAQKLAISEKVLEGLESYPSKSKDMGYFWWEDWELYSALIDKKDELVDLPSRQDILNNWYSNKPVRE